MNDELRSAGGGTEAGTGSGLASRVALGGSEPAVQSMQEYVQEFSESDKVANPNLLSAGRSAREFSNWQNQQNAERSARQFQNQQNAERSARQFGKWQDSVDNPNNQPMQNMNDLDTEYDRSMEALRIGRSRGISVAEAMNLLSTGG